MKTSKAAGLPAAFDLCLQGAAANFSGSVFGSETTFKSIRWLADPYR
jgi:hypothetical protein